MRGGLPGALLRLAVAVFLLVVLGARAHGAVLPSFLTEARDQRYLERDPEKRRAFFETLRREVEALKEAVRAYQPQDQEERKTLKEALDLFETLPLLWQKIELEVAGKPETETIVLKEERKDSYSLQDFRLLLAQGYQLHHELEALRGKLRLEEQELSRLSDTLDDVARACLLLVQKELDPGGYLRLAEYLNLQAQWALAELEHRRTAARLSYLRELRARWRRRLEEVFARLSPGPEEVKEAQAEAQEAAERLEERRRANLREKEKAEKELALIEIRLTKIKPASTGRVIAKSSYYETRKKVIETSLQLAAEEERLAALRAEHLRLWAALAACLARCPRGKEIENLSAFKERLRELDDLEESVRYRLDYVRERRILVQNNLLLHQEEMKAVKDRNRLYYWRLTVKEEKRLVQALKELKDTLQEELTAIQRFSFEGGHIVELWEARLSPLEKLWDRLKKTCHRSAALVRSFFFYPLFKTEGTVFTVASLLRIILVLVAGIVLLRLVRRRLERFLVQNLKMAPGVVNSLSTLAYYLLLCLVVVVALSSAGVNMSQVALIFGALSVGIGFGLQTIANNFVSGIILLTERSIKVGDLVQLEDGTLGEVQKINIRSTVIRTFDALEIIVPNSEFVSQRISTWTYEDDWRRLVIPFGVAYGSDPALVERVAREAARRVSYTREEPGKPIVVRFVGFGDSSLDFELAVWIRQADARQATKDIKSDYYFALHRALTEAGVEIPFPQRDLHLRTVHPGAVEGLRQVLNQGETP